MNIKSTSSNRRSYDNSLREEQAELTRERIVSTLSKLISDGQTDLSVPKLAEAAGVSAPTIYRYFPNRQSLYDGVHEWLGRELGRPDMPDELDESLEKLEELFRYYDANETLLKTTLSSEFKDLHGVRQKERDRYLEKILSGHTADLEERRANAVHALIRTFYGYDGYRIMKERFGVSPEEAAEVVRWATRTLVDQLKQNEGDENEPG